MTIKLTLMFLVTLISITSVLSHTHVATETEMFAVPISPNMFNWTYQEFDQQYRFHASLQGKPALPSWLRYIYSGRHHSGFIFGTPPRGTKSPLNIEVIGLNRQDYETRRLLLTIDVQPKEKMARHEVELKIDNLNVEDLLDEHRMVRLKDIFRTKLWSESSQDLYPTFLASAIDLGARLPLKPNDGEGLVVRLGSSMPFSDELRRLREEVRPLSRIGNCPREYKRTTVERRFRDAGLTLDWCNFQLYNTIYKDRSTELTDYLSETPNTITNTRAKMEKQPLLNDGTIWTAPSRADLPSRSYMKEFTVAVVVPILLMLVSITALTAVLCVHYAGMPDNESEYFFQNIFHLCTEYKRAHKASKVELCRYATGSAEQTNAQQHISKTGNSSNNNLARPYSPKSTTNLAASYNRPQPPPYMGTNTNSLHHRKSTIDKTTPSTSGHTPEHSRGHMALEESLKLLNEANISSVDYIDNTIPKDPIVDLNDGADDYVPIKPEQTGYVKNLDDINVPDLSNYTTIGGPI